MTVPHRRTIARESLGCAARCAVEALERRLVLSHIAQGLVDAPQTYSGPLSGKVVFTSPGHGWQWNSTLGRYATDRPEYQLLEDFGTQDQLTFYADYLLRAGATVVPMRPVGRQINEVVVDNDSAGATFTGSWSNSVGTKYYDEDYGAGIDTVAYRFASTTSGAATSTATYTPNIPAAGFYPVYTWALRSTNRTTQLYRINHTGGSTEIRVDHRAVGNGWVYLGTYHFGAGTFATQGSVQISNSSPVAGVVIADAIRFGNGMGDFTDAGAPGPSGYPREDENSYKWIQRMLGVGTTSTEAIGSGTSNVSAPSNMAQWMYSGAFGDAVYVGIHSNGTTGDPNTATARGARGLITTSGATPNQSDLALFLGRQINQDMQNQPGVFEHNWYTGSTHTGSGSFGEIDLGAGAEMDATIIEVAFHDNIQDGALLRDPKARDAIARAIYQGTLEYFDVHGGLATPTSLPTAPINLHAVSNSSGQVTLNWSAGLSTPASVNGAAATGYKVYASIDGYAFDGGTVVAGGGTTSVTLSGYDPTLPYYFRITATNAGGESKGSEVVTVLPSGGAKQVLIVNGFDRYDRTQDFAYPYAYTADGLVDRVWARHNNSFDYVVQVHSAIHASKPGTHVASANNDLVISGAVNLADYDIVIWISGVESTANDTFNATEQTKVEQFLAGGGCLFVSGAEIGWDLDQQNNGRTFYENSLKGNYVSDDAGTYTAVVDAGGIFAGLSSLVFSNDNAFSSLDSQMYNVAFPDVIAPQAGAITALTYSGGLGGTAGIQAAGTGGRGSLVMFGFPFETMTNATRRQQVMGRILDFFTSVAPATPNLAAASDTGILDTDNRTNRNNSVGKTLDFTVGGTSVGALVRLYADGTTLIGQATATGATTTVTTNGTALLSNGAHTITATQTEVGQSESAHSTGLTVTIDTVPAAVPAGLAATLSISSISLDWSDVAAGDLWGYNVYRSTTSGSGYVKINGSVVTTSDYVDNTAAPGTTYFYVIRSVDTADNESANSTETQAMIFAYISGSTLNVLFNGSGAPVSLTRVADLVSAEQNAQTLSFDVADFSSINVAGTALNDSLSFEGPITEPVVFNGGAGDNQLYVIAGTFTFSADAASTSDNLGIEIDSGAAVIFDATQHLRSLVVNGDATLTAGESKIIVTKDLVVTGRLDLSDNDLIWDYTGTSPLGGWNGTAYTDAIGLVQSGRGNGTWNGNGIVTSMSDATAGTLTSIALSDSASLLDLDAGETGTFSGETVDDTALLFKYTWGGDADMDGDLDGDDYFQIDSFIAQSGSVFGYPFGDFDYDGDIDGDDYFTIDANIGPAQGLFQ